jgi:hypothetical protein
MANKHQILKRGCNKPVEQALRNAPATFHVAYVVVAFNEGPFTECEDVGGISSCTYYILTSASTQTDVPQEIMDCLENCFNDQWNMSSNIHTYLPLTLYPRRGSRGISDIPLRHPRFTKISEL